MTLIRGGWWAVGGRPQSPTHRASQRSPLRLGRPGRWEGRQRSRLPETPVLVPPVPHGGWNEPPRPLRPPGLQGEWTAGRAGGVRGPGCGGVRWGSPSPKLPPHQGPGERPGWGRTRPQRRLWGCRAGEGCNGCLKAWGRLTPAWVSPELVRWGQEPWVVGQDALAPTARQAPPLGSWGPVTPLSNEANALKTPGAPHTPLSAGPGSRWLRGARGSVNCRCQAVRAGPTAPGGGGDAAWTWCGGQCGRGDGVL